MDYWVAAVSGQRGHGGQSALSDAIEQSAFAIGHCAASTAAMVFASQQDAPLPIITASFCTAGALLPITAKAIPETIRSDNANMIPNSTGFLLIKVILFILQKNRFVNQTSQFYYNGCEGIVKKIAFFADQYFSRLLIKGFQGVN